MLVTAKKPLKEILESLKNEKNIFLLACNGCPEACQTGGEKALKEMKQELQKQGKTITGSMIIDFLCNKILVGMRLGNFEKKLTNSDSILVLSCGIGVQAVSKILDKVVHPGLNTISMGGFQGLWPSDERCEECGDCLLDATGGICPVTFCSKSLLNGPCGGASQGMCEVDKEKECGWLLIYERLKKKGQLDKLKKSIKPRDYKNMLPSFKLRKTYFYNIEQEK